MKFVVSYRGQLTSSCLREFGCVFG